MLGYIDIFDSLDTDLALTKGRYEVTVSSDGVIIFGVLPGIISLISFL